MAKAHVINIDFDRKNDLLIINCKIKDSMYVEYGKYSKTLLNSAPLIEGVNYVLEHGHEAVAAFKGNTEFQKLLAENKRLKERLRLIEQFEAGERVKIDGFTFQKGINESSFYSTFTKVN